MQPYNPGPADPMKETGQRIRRFGRIVAIVLIAGFIITFVSKTWHEHRVSSATEESAGTEPLVNAVIAKAAPPTLTLKLPGETAAWYASTLYARVDGYVGAWNVDIGDKVKKNQVLATIETPDLDAQLAASKAKLQAAQALVTARQSDAEFAKTTYERWRSSPKGVVSEQEREAKKADYDGAVAKLSEAQAQVTLDQSDVDRYTVLTQFKQVLAPYDGKITERHIDIGNLVTAGSSANTSPLYKMVQDNPLRVFVDVPQSAAADMKAGLDADITADNFPGKTFKGKVTRTADALDPQARTLKVEVDIPNPDETLVPGMYVNITFALPSAGLVEVPAAAMLFRSNGPHIAVIKDNKVEFHPVVITRDNGSHLYIGSGLAAGDTVALNLGSQISEGEKVQVHTDEEAAHAPAK